MSLTEQLQDLHDEMAPDWDYEDAPSALEDPKAADLSLMTKGDLERELDTAREVMNAEIHLIKDWYEGIRTDVEGLIDWHARQLAEFHRRALEVDGKAKTIRLPHGTLKSREGTLSVEVEDRDAYVAWARENGREGLLRQTWDVNRDALKTDDSLGTIVDTAESGRFADPETGDVVPGVSWRRPDRTFSSVPK